MKIDPFDFDKLIAPVSTDLFFRDYWEKKPLILANRNARGYENLISLKDVEYLLSTLTSATMIDSHGHIPWVRFANQKRKAYLEDHLLWLESRPTALLSKTSILKGYNEGNTVILNALQKRWEPIRKLCSYLEGVFGHRIGTNMYLTPPNSQGFQAHYDSHDVFILQIEGTKTWKIYAAYIPFPIGTEDIVYSGKLEAPIHEVPLKAGDLLYIPRGYVHEALTTDQMSLHLTVGLHVFTWADVFQEIAQESPDLRRALPRGILFENGPIHPNPGALEQFTQTYQNSAVWAKVFQKLQNRFFQLMTKSFDIGLESAFVDLSNENALFKKREGLRVSLNPGEGELTLRFEEKIVKMPAHIKEIVEYVIQQDQFSLQSLPDVIDLTGKKTFISKFIKMGFLEIARK